MSTPDESREARAPPAGKPIIGYLFDAANLVTMAGLLSSIAAITFAVRGEFHAAAIGMVLAFFFDGIDGPVAKRLSGRTDANRAFGANLDSLVDMVGAGATLAVVVLAYGEFDAVFVPGALAIAGAAALRLSYFNVHGLAPGTKSYVGLPTDQAIIVMAAVMLLDGTLDHEAMQITIYASIVAVAAVMVSPLRIPKLFGVAFYVFNAIAFAIAAGHAVRLV